MKLAVLVVILILLAMSAISTAKASTDWIVDQRCDQTTGCCLALQDNISIFAPVGQTFVPRYHAPGKDYQLLTGVEIYMTHFGGSTTDTFLMSILEGGASGQIVAEQYFSTTSQTNGWWLVSLPSVVLTTDELYAFTIEPNSPGAWNIVSDGRTYGNTYADGCWILNGKENGSRAIGNDLAFRTYVDPDVPEAPSVLLALGGGLVGFISIVRRRPRR